MQNKKKTKQTKQTKIKHETEHITQKKDNKQANKNKYTNNKQKRT